MRGSRYSEEQITAILEEAEVWKPICKLSREHGVTDQTYYRWKVKCGEMEVLKARRLRHLEDENRKNYTDCSRISGNRKRCRTPGTGGDRKASSTNACVTLYLGSRAESAGVDSRMPPVTRRLCCIKREEMDVELCPLFGVPSSHYE